MNKGSIGAAKNSNDATRAIGRTIGIALISLTSSSQQFRLGKVEVLEVLKDRFALCGSKVVATVITQKLPSVLFLPRLTL